MNLFKKYKKYKKMNIKGQLISLDYRDMENPYFCYPVNAEVIGFEENILYCFLPEYGEMVFASQPDSCVETNVYPLARTFEDFLRLIISCGSANPIEQIIWMNKERFVQHVNNEKKIQTHEQRDLIKRIQKEFDLTPMNNPFEYVKELQRNFDGSHIRYSDEYYETLGLDNPHEI